VNREPCNEKMGQLKAKILFFSPFSKGGKRGILEEGNWGQMKAIEGKKEKAKIFFSLLATFYSLLKEEGMKQEMERKYED